MEKEVYDYNERDGWPDELIAAHWRMCIAAGSCGSLKQRAAETGLLTVPVMVQKIKEAEQQTEKATQTYKTTYERWKK